MAVLGIEKSTHSDTEVIKTLEVSLQDATDLAIASKAQLHYSNTNNKRNKSCCDTAPTFNKTGTLPLAQDGIEDSPGRGSWVLVDRSSPCPGEGTRRHRPAT